MCSVGFPKGLCITAQCVAADILCQEHQGRYQFIASLDNIPIGELNYKIKGKNIAEIGIKICVLSARKKGYGKILLSLLIDYLFHEGYQKIVLNMNPDNVSAQSVYIQLGFKKRGEDIHLWTDQSGQIQSSIEYELSKENFLNFAL